MTNLKHRLASMRRRHRVVVTFRGLCWLIAMILAAAVLACSLDWLVHLPSLVRAVALVFSLTGAGLILYLYLFRPLGAPVDDLTLALRVEEIYPALNDSLASTVEFLQQAEDSDQGGSPAMKRAAIRRTLDQVEG